MQPGQASSFLSSHGCRDAADPPAPSDRHAVPDLQPPLRNHLLTMLISALHVHAGEECYMVCDKGPINPMHVLILPVEHQASCVSVPASTYAEIERYLSALRSAFASQVSAPGVEKHFALCTTMQSTILRKYGWTHSHLE